MQRISTRRKHRRSEGAVIAELSIVLLIFLLLVAAILEFGHVFFAQQYLNSIANTMLERAAYESEIEIPGDDGTENDAAMLRVREEAMRKLAVHFKNGTGEVLAGYASTDVGRRVTSIELEIGELDEDDEIRPDLRRYLRDNPMIATITAEFDSFFNFFPYWSLTAQVAGFVEPRYITTLGNIFDCNGRLLTAQDIVNGLFPDRCPCEDLPGAHAGTIQVGGVCSCVEPIYTFVDGTGNGIDDPPAGPDGLLDHGDECVCNLAITNKDPNCSCKTCEERDYPNAQLNPDNCSCTCPPPLVLATDGSKECICRGASGGTGGGCDCDVNEFDAKFCKPQGMIAVKEGSACRCETPCTKGGCWKPKQYTPWECVCEAGCPCKNETPPGPWWKEDLSSCGCSCDRNVRGPSCAAGQIATSDCKCSQCQNGTVPNAGQTYCSCPNGSNGADCWNDSSRVICGGCDGSCLPCPTQFHRRKTRFSCDPNKDCSCEISLLEPYCDSKKLNYNLSKCDCEPCKEPLKFINGSCRCDCSGAPGRGWTCNLNTNCEHKCLGAYYQQGNDCVPNRCLYTNGCYWNGSDWAGNE